MNLWLSAVQAEDLPAELMHLDYFPFKLVDLVTIVHFYWIISYHQQGSTGRPVPAGTSGPGPGQKKDRD
jgi:hypothetical protein